MSRKIRHTFVVVATLVSLALPLTAQARPSRQDQQDRQQNRTERMIADLWNRLKAPFAVFLDGVTPPPVPPAPPAAPGDTTDGRSILDPIG